MHQVSKNYLLQSEQKLGGIAGTPFKVVDVVFYCFDYFIMLPVTIAIMSLFVYQISCLLVNLTSIEDYIYTRIKRIAKRTGVVRNIFC